MEFVLVGHHGIFLSKISKKYKILKKKELKTEHPKLKFCFTPRRFDRNHHVTQTHNFSKSYFFYQPFFIYGHFL